MLHEVPIVSVRIESEAGNPTDEIKSVLKRLSDPRTLGGKLLPLLLNSEKGSVWIEYLHGRECSIEILFSASRTLALQKTRCGERESLKTEEVYGWEGYYYFSLLF
jgi:hypothetical protein